MFLSGVSSSPGFFESEMRKRIIETMRNIFFGILVFVLLTSSLFAQEFVDASNWFYQTGTHDGSCYFAVNSKTGEVAYDAFLNGTTYKPTNLLPISNLSTLPYSNYQGMRYLTTTGNISFFDEYVVYYPFLYEGTWFHIVDKPVQVAVVTPNSTTYKIYSIPKITVNPSTFIQLLDNSGGGDPGTDPPDPPDPPPTDPPEVDADLEGVVTILLALLDVAKDNAALLRELNVLGQYLIGLLSFVSGVLLAFVFVFGLS